MSPTDFREATAFARLLAEARAGSSDALGRALMACRDDLLRAADRKLDPELRRKVSAADLVQETFLEALRRFVRFQGKRREELRAWLGQILFHIVANEVRRYRDTEKRAVDREQPLREMIGGTPHPSDRLADDEETAALAKALSQLPEYYRRVLHLRSQEKQKYAQIGATLHCSAGAARKIWERGVNHLKKLLRPHHGVV